MVVIDAFGFNPSKIRWDLIEQSEIKEIENAVKECLSEKEINEIDIRILGDVVLCRSRILSIKVKQELLRPISIWLNDPQWIKKFKDDKSFCGWALYKSKQRKWTKKQKQLAADRLKLYRQEILKKQHFRKELKRIFDVPKVKKEFKLSFQNGFIEPIISVFTPVEQHRREIEQLFFQAKMSSISHLLPWRLLILAELIKCDCKNLGELKTYYHEDERRDRVLKFIHLLDLENNGEIALTQDEPFGDIAIQSQRIEHQTNINITDQHGKDYQYDWIDLNKNQQTKIIDDIKQHRIVCKWETEE
ncbi:MAG: segregation/condensation protein A [Desulfobacteraceae bacterium]|nr:segregation/condensation protein A [Desulfobacteraceae bacterium]MBC2755181.1 segregation/condensation protein A [Desulfobacteraceae bacterium]